MRKRILFAILACTCAGPLRAQSPGLEPGTSDGTVPVSWMANVNYAHDVVSDDRTDWDRATVTAGRRFARGAVLLEAGWNARFGSTAASFGLDTYADIWRAGHVNVRFLHSPDGEIIATNDIYAQLSQAVGRGVELTAAYHVRDYTEQTVHAGAAQLALYTGNWYLRSRTSVLPHEGEVGVVQQIAARRFWSTPHDFVEVTASAGRGVELVGQVPQLLLTRTYSVSARLQRLLTSNFGLSILAGYTDEDFYRRTTFGAGITVIW